MANQRESYYKPSRITIPAHAHPLARLAFTLMRDTGTTYDSIEWTSGVQRSTLKEWRTSKTPSLQSIEAVLGALGWRLVAIPPLENLPADTLDALEAIGQNFRSDDETVGAVLAAINFQGKRCTADAPAPRLKYREPYWEKAA